MPKIPLATSERVQKALADAIKKYGKQSIKGAKAEKRRKKPLFEVAEDIPERSSPERKFDIDLESVGNPFASQAEYAPGMISRIALALDALMSGESFDPVMQYLKKFYGYGSNL